MSVSSIIGGGIRLVRTQPRTVVIWSAIHVVFLIGFMLALMPMMGSMMALQGQMAANTAAGITTPPIFPSGFFGALFIVEILFAALMAIIFAAAVRAVARPVGDRFAYLRVGMDELRLIGLGFIFIIAAIGAEILAVIILMLIGGLFGLMLGKTAGIAVAVIFGIVLFLGAIYAQVRLSLAGALTVIKGRIVIADAWRATKGQFWTLFSAYFLMALAYFIFTIGVIAITNFAFLAAYFSLNQQAIAAAGEAQAAKFAAGVSLGWIVQMAITAIVSVAMWAVTFGAIGTAAIELGSAVEPIEA
jgi:hypothetical protein